MSSLNERYTGRRLTIRVSSQWTAAHPKGRDDSKVNPADRYRP